MAEYLIQDNTLTDIADAIREKTNTTESIMPIDFAALIKSISGGDGNGLKLRETPLAKTGTFKPTSETAVTITHDLGVVPDYVMIGMLNDPIGTIPYVTLYSMGWRSGFPFTYGGDSHQIAVTRMSNGNAFITGLGSGIDTAGSSLIGFRDANESTVTFGGSLSRLNTNLDYYNWYAVRLFE